MIKIGLIGCGRIGRMHADNVASYDMSSIEMVYDAHGPSAAEVGKKHSVRIASSAKELMTDKQVDAVLIASSTPTHADYIEFAVAQNKPVLCEKPIDLSLSRVILCEERIKNRSVPVQMGFNRRFDPGHRRARELAHSGAIGELQQVIITSRDPEMPPDDYYRVSGGLFRDMTIHDFDMARYLLADEPVEVFATASRLINPKLMNEIDDYDTAMIVMRTANGKQCHINNSRSAVYGYDQRFEFMGSKGMVQSGNQTSDAVTSFGPQNAEVKPPYHYFFTERYHTSFIEEIKSFVACIEQGKPPQASFADGRQALILAEAAYLSIKQKRMVRVDEVH